MMILRKENATDIPGIYEVNLLAFKQEGEAKLVDALRLNSKVFIPELSIVSEQDNQIVGHILFTKIKIKDSAGDEVESLSLAPMAVRPELQKQGIGSQLIRKGLETARELGYRSVIVLGHENYYPKFGFEPAIKWNIKAPFDVPSNVFMGIELISDGLKGIHGTVIYPSEFDTV